MENVISSSHNKITVNNDDLNTCVAVKLMEHLFDMHARGRKNIVLDLREVRSYSAVGLHVILSAMELFGDFHLEGVETSMRNQLSKALAS